jgi:hypothetical protein
MLQYNIMTHKNNLLSYIVVKITVFCDVTSCSLVDEYHHFRGNSCLHILDRITYIIITPFYATDIIFCYLIYEVRLC